MLQQRLRVNRGNLVDDKKFCKNCGGAISPDHKFCGNCGAMLGGELDSITLEENSALVEGDFHKKPQDRLLRDTMFRCSKCDNKFKMTKGMSYPEDCPHCGYVRNEFPSQIFLTRQPDGGVLCGEIPSTMLEESTSVDTDLSKMNHLELPQDAKRQCLEGGNTTQESNDNGGLFCMNCGNALPEKAWLCIRCGRPVSDEKAIKRWANRQEKLGSKRGALQSGANRNSAAPPDETRFICNSCNHMWFIDDVEAVKKANKLAKIHNAGRALTPIMWVTKKHQLVDLEHCPSCGSKNIRQDAMRYGDYAQTAPQTQTLTAPAADTFDALEKLAALRDKGILTEQEFQEQKKKLLGS